MAFDVTGLSNYTKEESLQLLTKAMFTAKTANLLNAAGQVLPNIKSAEILPLLYSDVYFQSDSCSYQTSGNTTLSKRTLTVGKVKVQETLCRYFIFSKLARSTLPMLLYDKSKETTLKTKYFILHLIFIY